MPVTGFFFNAMFPPSSWSFPGMYYSLKCKKYFQIKVFYFIYHQFHHGAPVKGLAVGAVLAQGTEHVAYPQDPGADGNLFPCQIGRVTASIVIFMMIENTLKNKI